MEPIEEKSVQWMNENKENILKKIVTNKNPRKAKECILMAGSPGAGKTETVKRLKLRETFIVLEADEIRVLNDHYQKATKERAGNAHLIQKAASIGLDYCRAYCIENDIAFVQDTTLSNRGSIDMVRKLLNSGWKITIIFIFQDPKKAWEFTKAREAKEGRNIPKESFAKSFANIVENIRKVQEKHPKAQVVLNIKNGKEVIKYVKLKGENIESILTDNGIKVPKYTDALKLIDSHM